MTPNGSSFIFFLDSRVFLSYIKIVMKKIKGVPIYKTGKVRDVYDLGDRLLIVASDRISAFDVVLGSKIPEKGKILTLMSIFWMNKSEDIIENHLISTNIDNLPEKLNEYKSLLSGRIMITKKATSFPIEAVARGYLAGSGWKEYKEKGSICGISLPEGLLEADELPEPIFTPATKAEKGHDINITQQEAEILVGKDNLKKIKDVTLKIYSWAKQYAHERGIIIADTKFEFGYLNEKIILIDEMLTPDSSRFWPLDGYEPGQPQPSYDKQYVRDYLESTGWNKKPPAPLLPEEIIKRTQEKYRQAFNLLTKQ